MMMVSRRAIIGGGAALAGVSAVAGFGGGASTAIAGSANADLEPDIEDIEALDVPVMISVVDAQAGELEILIGEQAIAFTDRRLVNRLIRAAREEA